MIIKAEDRKRIGNGGQHLFGSDTLDGRRAAVLVEGELDALLLAQEASDLVGVVTLGSCSKGLDQRVIPHLLPITPILVAYDTDEAGQTGARRLAAISKRVRLIRVPSGKDITEAFLFRVDLRAWVLAELRAAGVTVEDLPSPRQVEAKGGAAVVVNWKSWP